MSTRLKLEKVQVILVELVGESSRGVPIVVEGVKDVEALRALGVAGLVLTVKTGGKSFLEACEEILETGASEVILLLDFDFRGRKGISRLKQDLERAKVKANMRYWRELSALLGREIQSIESLTAYLQTAERKASSM